MSAQRIYLLERMVDDPRFEGFAFAKRQRSLLGNTELEDDFTADDWDVPRLASRWKPPKVVGRVRKFNDFPCVNLTIPAFSQRAADALRDVLESNGELLPLDADLGSYYAFHVTTVVDALDQSASHIDWFPSPPKRVLHIHRFEFMADVIQELTIFTIPQKPSQVFVTDAFISRVLEVGLEGFDCPLLWPLPAGVNWMILHKQQGEKRARRGLKKGQTLKGNSLVIVLALHAKKPSSSERQRMHRLMDELDAILVEPDSAAPAVGNVEGHDYAGPTCRIFISCPDVDALIGRLRPLLETFVWEQKVEVFARRGEYIDAGIPGVHVPIARRG